nr:unnamed protein product [Digitaria exilis]
MGKQQQAPPSRRGPAMSAPQPPRKRKKKGRPSLLDLQKRSLRLEQQLLQEQQQQPQGRRGTRRNPGSADDDDEGPASGSGRREKKLRLVMGLHDGSAKGEKTRKATDGREEPSDSGPTTPLPNKKLLLFILDRLQKKDTYGVFSEPVDPEELPDYHDIIKHPMDFSTIRKKLDKGAYSNLEQFEVGVQLQQSYSRSLARFAAQLGSIGWEIASRRIERSLPPGTKFGRGWVGDGEAPSSFQPPVLAAFSEAMTPPSNIAASGQRTDSEALARQQCGSTTQIPIHRGEHGAEMKGSHNNLHGRPVTQQTVNGFNAVPGPMMFPPAAQLVVNQMQTHTAD